MPASLALRMAGTISRPPLGAMIRPSTELKEMLKQDLELEREAMGAYMAAWASCDDEDLPQKFWLEGQISASVQSPHRGLRASHTRRPCRITRSENRPQSFGGSRALSAA